MKKREPDANNPHACSITITCCEPDGQGDMHVDMSYEGDPCLVAFLLQGALNRVEEEVEEQIDQGLIQVG